MGRYTCGQTFDVSGDTLDQMNIRVNELEPSGPTLDQREEENEHPKSQEMSETELDSLPIDTLSQSLLDYIPYIVSESSKR